MAASIVLAKVGNILVNYSFTVVTGLQYCLGMQLLEYNLTESLNEDF